MHDFEVDPAVAGRLLLFIFFSSSLMFEKMEIDLTSVPTPPQSNFTKTVSGVKFNLPSHLNRCSQMKFANVAKLFILHFDQGTTSAVNSNMPTQATVNYLRLRALIFYWLTLANG